MALFNEVLEGRYGLILNKLLSMKGGPPAPQLSGDLTAGFSLENDAPEWYALGGGRLCIGWGNLAAGGAGFRSQVVLSNPTASGILIRVEAVYMASATAVFGFPLSTNINLTGFATATNVGLMDTRLQQTPAGIIATKNSAAVVGTIRGVVFPNFSAAAIYAGVHDRPWVLGPGTSLGVDPGSDNVTMQAVFFWRERAAGPAELAVGA